MSERLNAEIKTRVPGRVRRQLQQLANDRHLDLSDLAREALREYIASRTVSAEKKEVAA